MDFNLVFDSPRGDTVITVRRTISTLMKSLRLININLERLKAAVISSILSMHR